MREQTATADFFEGFWQRTAESLPAAGSSHNNGDRSK
jgi:hypothetical protein